MSQTKKLLYNSFYLAMPLSILLEYGLARGVVSYNIFISLAKFTVLFLMLISLGKLRFNKGNRMVVTFLLYVVFSGFFYLFINRPFGCYVDALSNFILPISMFFIGSNPEIDGGKYLRYFSYAFSIMIIITLFAYLSQSSWYVNYRSSNWDAQNVDYLTEKMRFSGVYGTSYSIMYQSLPLLCFLLLSYKKLVSNSIMLISMTVINTVALVFCQQRTALLFTIIVLFFYFFTLRKLSHSITSSILFVLGIFLVVFVASDLLWFQEASSLVQERFGVMTFSEAFGERRDKVFAVFNVWKNYVFGDGTGVYSHYAFYNGYQSVNDCAWIKLLTENGVIGVLLFVSIVVKALSHAIKNSKQYYPEILIIVFYLVAMIGSDSLSMNFPLALFFWFAIGRIWQPSLRH